MLTKIKDTKELPYKTYVATLLKSEEDAEKICEKIDGMLLITESPRMIILFVEYIEGEYRKLSKEVWNGVQ